MQRFQPIQQGYNNNRPYIQYEQNKPSKKPLNVFESELAEMMDMDNFHIIYFDPESCPPCIQLMKLLYSIGQEYGYTDEIIIQTIINNKGKLVLVLFYF
jgi:thiol-disulfide isomerase/thioredoxin